MPFRIIRHACMVLNILLRHEAGGRRLLKKRRIMWIAFRLDEGDFLLPSPGSEDRAQEQNHQ
jgi:hypothetical protein